MGRIDETLDMNAQSAIYIPTGVAVVARPEALDALAPIEADIDAIPVSPNSMPPRARIEDAELLVLEVDPADRSSIERLDGVRQNFPDMPVIAAVRALDVAASRALMRRGVADFVELPFQIEELLAAIADVHRVQLQRSDNPADLATFIVVTKSIGGAGSTTIATHLAAALAEARSDYGKACVIDCDLQSGDVGAYLG